MPDYLGLCLQLDRTALSQYANWNFNSMCKFGDKYLGANENGIFELDSGDLDNTEQIESFFELVTSEWGLGDFQKRIRSIYIGYETNGNLQLTVKDDDNNERQYVLKPNHTLNKQHSVKLAGTRDGKGRFWMLRIDNLNGADFSVDRISVVPVVLNRKPSAA